MADSAIGSTLLAVTPVVARGVHPAKDHVSVLIKEVVRDKNSLYVPVCRSNTGSHPYRIVSPNVFTIIPTKNAELLAGLKNLDSPEQATYQFQSGETSQVTVRGTAPPEKDVQPGATGRRSIGSEPADVQKAGVYEFIFGNDGTHRMRLRRCSDGRARIYLFLRRRMRASSLLMAEPVMGSSWRRCAVH